MAQFELITDGLRFPEGPVAMADGSVRTISGGISHREVVNGRVAGIEFGVNAVMGSTDGVWDLPPEVKMTRR